MLRFAPSNTEQAYRDQQKIEALARYISAVRSNAHGLPRGEMQPRFGPEQVSAQRDETTMQTTDLRKGSSALQSTNLSSLLVSRIQADSSATTYQNSTLLQSVLGNGSAPTNRAETFQGQTQGALQLLTQPRL